MSDVLPTELGSEPIPAGAIPTKYGGWLKPFQKGQSGNPGGFNAKRAEVQQACRSKSMASVNKLVELMKDEDARVAYMACVKIMEWSGLHPEQAGPADIEGTQIVEDNRQEIKAFLAEFRQALRNRAAAADDNG